jgi:large subunit ribosomal protein L32
MTIGPKKKISKSVSRTRHATWETINLKRMTKTYQVGKCANCWAKKLSHRVCPVCWYYKGKQVITIKAKGGEKIVDA